jgi:2-dehydro-3-deoxyglucarate aldolase/4-hydroxy-2-oxoheptanedioate aldolase
VCEILAAVGYDAVFIDGEHGTLSHISIDPIVALARSLGLQVFCRVATADRPHVQQALDSGADGLVLPQIRDFAQAREVTEYAKYAPLGSRGMGTPRSLNYRDTPATFVADENRRTKCFVMIETEKSFEDVAKIAALPTVDGLFMGPYDLSLSRGRGQYQASAADRKDAEHIAAAAASAGKLLGIPAFQQSDFAFARKHSAYVITIADDISVLVEGLRAKREGARW